MPGATVRLVKLPALLFAIFFLLVAFIHVSASNIEEDVLEGKDISSMVAQGEELVNSRMFTEAKVILREAGGMGRGKGARGAGGGCTGQNLTNQM